MLAFVASSTAAFNAPLVVPAAPVQVRMTPVEMFEGGARAPPKKAASVGCFRPSVGEPSALRFMAASRSRRSFKSLEKGC